MISVETFEKRLHEASVRDANLRRFAEQQQRELEALCVLTGRKVEYHTHGGVAIIDICGQRIPLSLQEALGLVDAEHVQRA